MMKTAMVLMFLVGLAAPVRAQSEADLARSAASGVDVAAVTAALKEAGHPAADIELVTKGLNELGAASSATTTSPAAAPLAPTATQRAQVSALGSELTRRGVPERLIHPVLWAVQDRRFPRVDPTPLFAQLRSMSLDPSAIQKMMNGQIRVYAKERTDVAEAQYEFISNSLYLPPDYLEPGATPPRLKARLSSAELNTVMHEIDHAEKDLLTNDREVYGKNLGGAIMAGIRSAAFPAIGAGVLGLALSAIPKLAMAAPVVGLSVMGAIVAGGAIYGAYQWYKSRDQNPRDARQQAARDALEGIADTIRRDPKQKEIAGITEARSKAWEVSGYFMGDSVSDILDQVDTIKLEQFRRIRQATTPAEVEAAMREVVLPASLQSRKFGDSTRGGDAWFRVKPVEFPYKDHPELFQKLYANSLGIKPPADARELVARINADPTLFPELREYMQKNADKRLRELAAASAGASAAPGGSPAPALPPPDRSDPNFADMPVTR